MNLVWAILEPFLGYILAFGAGAIALLGVWTKAKKSGRDEERNKQMKEAYENERKRTTLEDRIRNAGGDDRQRMRDPWYRD
jgi:Flp pilus assembly protein TadB